MIRRYRIPLGITAIVLVALGVAAFATSGTTPKPRGVPGLATVSAKGTPTTATANAQETLERFAATGRIGRTTGIRLIRGTGSRFYFRVDTSNGQSCFGASDRSGFVGSEVRQFGSLACPLPSDEPTDGSPFPSADLPILDMSLRMMTPTESATFKRIEGFAADGVAKVDVVRPNGSVALSIPVVNNVYLAPDVPSGVLAELVAVDANGTALYSVGT